MPAEELIHEIPPKVTHGSTAVCDGGLNPPPRPLFERIFELTPRPNLPCSVLQVVAPLGTLVFLSTWTSPAPTTAATAVSGSSRKRSTTRDTTWSHITYSPFSLLFALSVRFCVHVPSSVPGPLRSCLLCVHPPFSTQHERSRSFSFRSDALQRPLMLRRG
jgi:hypothetical protein